MKEIIIILYKIVIFLLIYFNFIESANEINELKRNYENKINA